MDDRIRLIYRQARLYCYKSFLREITGIDFVDKMQPASNGSTSIVP